MLDLPPINDSPNDSTNDKGAETGDTVSTPLDIKAIRAKLTTSQGQAYWRSLDELAETPEFQEFLEQEFPRQASPFMEAVDRRNFLKLMGASLAFAGLASCARPASFYQNKVLPYVRAPEEIVPGRPNFYASALLDGGYARGVLVESHQGRPTKVEGNPDHPANQGTSDIFMQAASLNMYDPDRSQRVTRGGEEATWDAFVEALSQADLSRARILTETVTSPTLAAQIRTFLEANPDARWHQYEPTHADNAHAGAMMAFGEPVITRYDFTKAEVVLSLDADFLTQGPGRLRYTKDFSSARRVITADDEMNRLYVVESTPTLTGTMADHRLPVKPSEVEGVARALAARLGIDVEGSLPATVPEAWLDALASDLQEHQGSSLVLAGDDQPAFVHALAHAMNGALGNIGETVVYTDPVEAEPVNQLESLRELVDDIVAGNVLTLVIIGGNPVYNALADLNFATALQQVPFSAHLSLYHDETSARAMWHLPMTHEFETWSDARAFDGTVSVIQPLIDPFYSGRSAHELLAALLGEQQNSYDIVQGHWREQLGDAFDSTWRQTLYRGVFEGSALEAKQVTLQDFLGEAAAQPGEGLEVLFRPDPSIGDGRYANNGWLQELPNPFTKLTWDNVALFSPATAERLGIADRDVVELTLDGRSVEAPAWLLVGQPHDVVTLHLGYGRERAGHIGSDIGYNAYLLRSTTAPYFAGGLEVRKVGRTYPLSSTQMHHAIDEGVERRHLIRHGTLEDFKAHPEHPAFAHPGAHEESDLYPDYAYNSYAWGMVIDQNVCISCNACVVACQAENNIPIVGKEQVSRGREMHWIRVDNYYRGDLDNPEYYSQPITCMHCEKAPCEPVCPFGATVHDHEGLNNMVYNRCGGTRYCSNNCPYKVRRFNWLQYNELPETMTELAMLQNPDVTVRSRGVMEKCSYCVQRIAGARINAEAQNRAIQDGEVVTACQAACPAEAIVFGDINDPESRVTGVKHSPLNYGLLTELNTVPRTTYLTKLRNPHPDLVGLETYAATSEAGGHQ